MTDDLSEKSKERAEVLRAFEQSRDPVLTISEIAEDVGASVEEMRSILVEMESDGMVKRKENVWWAVPAAYIEMEAVALLQPTTWSEPLSIEEIREIICNE